MTRQLTRRRFLTITAAAGGMAATGAAAGQAANHIWRGSALGAEAELLFAGADRRAADTAIRLCLDEIERLEAIFSLHRGDSELTRLNRDGQLDQASSDLLALMRLGRRFGDITDGAFDMTVQPLWRFLADHFNGNSDRAPPSPRDLNTILGRVDYRRVEITGQRIVLPPGAAVTLNGIAQGYITDRVADLLQVAGWRDVLINLGEIRTLTGRSWPVHIAGTRQQLDLSNKAIATSAGSGTPLSARGDWHHLIDPRTGRSAHHHASVTVVARRAVTADALSTALAVIPLENVKIIAARSRHTTVYIQSQDGQMLRL